MKHALLLFSFCLVSLFSQAQDSVDDAKTAFDSLKIFKSLSIALQNPDSVFSLDLSHKKLKEVPIEILKFKHLKVLRLSKNEIKEIPEWIGRLTELMSLDCSNNKLTLMPDSLGELTQLVFLGLNRNVITTLPHTIGQLVNLRTLEMWDNELDTVPDEMKNLRNLEVFELRGILFSQDEQEQISELLPNTKIYFSPTCNCRN